MMRRFLILAALILGTPVAAQADAPSDMIAKGQYLTRAADCQACHSAPNGVAFAGGRAFVLPFGVLYSPNITPDPTNGIAGYSDADWIRMLHHGVGRGAKHLYPAMPYPSYTGLSDDDALAIKAYLMSLAPVANTIPPNHIRFPFNQRWGMVFWNLLNNPDQRFTPIPAQSAAYNRGAYLVENLEHCGECHTPRNFMMATKTGEQMAGAKQDGWLAYNLTADKVTGIGGWRDADLAQYLATGTAPGHGPASGPMAEVVQDSTQYLSPDDIQDIVLYLRQVPAQVSGPPAVSATVTPAAANPLGAKIFAQACAGCHLPNGQGRQSTWAALQGSHSAGDVDGNNIVQILSQGSVLATAQGEVFMHPFTADYTDDELSAVGNYTISQFGGLQGHITPAQIRAQRQGKMADSKPVS